MFARTQTLAPRTRRDVLPQDRETSEDGAIDRVVADADDDAAHDLRVDLEGRAELLAARALELGEERRPLRLRERDRGHDDGLLDAGAGVEEVVEGARDARQERDALSFQERMEERADAGGLLRADALERAAAGL